jgi:transcription initiation factor TFIIE subunit alpha
MSGNEILIDGAGWGDLILGVVIGALKLPDHEYMERRIPSSSFQPPNFENKQYLHDAVKIVEEIVDVMRADKETRFKVALSLEREILSGLRRYLQDRGFSVAKAEITGELQTRVEKGYVEWCEEAGVPPERLKGERRFWTLLEWVAEEPKIREKLVKTGWKSWQQDFTDRDVLMKVARVLGGEEAVKTVEVLGHAYETTDMEIVAKSGTKLNTVRKILYKLYDHSLVALRRTRDRNTGWFTFHWKLQPDQIDGFLTNQKKRILEKLETRLDYEKNHDFYSCCTPGCRRLPFEEAIEHIFRCPKCGKPLTHLDNKKTVEFLSKKTKQLNNELNE